MNTVLLVLVMLLVAGLLPLYVVLLANAVHRARTRRAEESKVGQPVDHWQLGDFLDFYPDNVRRRERRAEFAGLNKAWYLRAYKQAEEQRTALAVGA